MDDYSQAEINIAVSQFREYCVEVLFKEFSNGLQKISQQNILRMFGILGLKAPCADELG